MKILLEIFNNKTLENEKKIQLIKSIGSALNYEYASNWTDEVVAQLVDLLRNKGLK